jgi:hypothetical protein
VASQLIELAAACVSGDMTGVCTFAAKKGAKWPVFDKVREQQ